VDGRGLGSELNQYVHEHPCLELEEMGWTVYLVVNELIERIGV